MNTELNHLRGKMENVDAVFVSQTKKHKLKRETVFRFEVAGMRHYLRKANQKSYKSLTTFLDSVRIKGKGKDYLESWRESQIEDLGGKEKLDELMESLASYGTALHIATAEFCTNGKVDWAKFIMWAYDFTAGMGLVGVTQELAVSELKNDFACMIQFIHDYEVEVLGIEIPVFSKNGFGTLIDLVCDMNECLYTDKTPKEKRKRVTASINLKSGKKGFHESHILQLIGERQMLKETHMLKVDRVYNLSPKNWRTAPTYDLKDQTAAANALQKKFDLLVKIAKLEGILDEPKRDFKTYVGVTEYGQSPIGCISFITYKELSDMHMQEQLAVSGIPTPKTKS